MLSWGRQGSCRWRFKTSILYSRHRRRGPDQHFTKRSKAGRQPGHGLNRYSAAGGRNMLDATIRNNADQNRYELEVDGDLARSEEHTSELQSRENLVCRLLLEK